MSVLVGPDTRLLVQGLGRDGSFQSSRCREYGTNMVAAVHPGRGGQKFEDAVPIYESAAEAVDQTGADVGVIFVPAPFAADAIIEQVDADLGLIIAITERIPVLDMVKILAYMKGKDTRLIGPNCPGLIQPATRAKIGIIPASIVREGRIGVVSTERNADVRGDCATEPVRHGRIDLRRDRRRSAARDDLYGRTRNVPGRP